MNDTRMATYSRLAIDLIKGKGALVWDAQGKEYLDAISGIAVCSLGHAPDEITAVICDQAGKLIHCSNIYDIQLQKQLADRLTALSGMDNVFFGNSGAEANEAAIKIARKYGNDRKIKNPVIVVTEGAFHGRTLATLTATGNRKIQAGFEPLVNGFVRARYGDIDALTTIAKSNNDVVAILVEPIQGEGGVIVPPDDYLDNIRKLCDQYQWLMMLDEIQTGMCRTGQWFAFQHSQSQADVITLAKSLGNGIPIGACLARGPAANVLKAGNHGSTFGGNPFACRTALAVIEAMDKAQLAKRAASLGNWLTTQFEKTIGTLKGVKSIRGKGLMIGIELEKPCAVLVGQAADQGLLINVTADKTIRLLPPLIMTDQQAEHLVLTLSRIIEQFLTQNG